MARNKNMVVEKPIRLSISGDRPAMWPTTNLYPRLSKKGLALRVGLHKLSQQMVDAQQPSNWVEKLRTKRRLLSQQNTKPQSSPTDRRQTSTGGGRPGGPPTNILKIAGDYGRALEKLSQQTLDSAIENAQDIGQLMDALRSAVVAYEAQGRAWEGTPERVEEEYQSVMQRVDHAVTAALEAFSQDPDMRDLPREDLKVLASNAALAELAMEQGNRTVVDLLQRGGTAERAAAQQRATAPGSRAGVRSAVGDTATAVGFAATPSLPLAVMFGIGSIAYDAQQLPFAPGATIDQAVGEADMQAMRGLLRAAESELQLSAARQQSEYAFYAHHRAKAAGDIETAEAAGQLLQQHTERYDRHAKQLAENWAAAAAAEPESTGLKRAVAETTNTVLDIAAGGTYRAGFAQFPGGVRGQGMGNRFTALLTAGTPAVLQMMQNDPQSFSGLNFENLDQAVESISAVAPEVGAQLAANYYANTQVARTMKANPRAVQQNRGASPLSRAADTAARGKGVIGRNLARGRVFLSAAMAPKTLGASVAAEAAIRNVTAPFSRALGGGSPDLAAADAAYDRRFNRRDPLQAVWAGDVGASIYDRVFHRQAVREGRADADADIADIQAQHRQAEGQSRGRSFSTYYQQLGAPSAMADRLGEVAHQFFDQAQSGPAFQQAQALSALLQQRGFDAGQSLETSLGLVASGADIDEATALAQSAEGVELRNQLSGLGGTQAGVVGRGIFNALSSRHGRQLVERNYELRLPNELTEGVQSAAAGRRQQDADWRQQQATEEARESTARSLDTPTPTDPYRERRQRHAQEWQDLQAPAAEATPTAGRPTETDAFLARINRRDERSRSVDAYERQNRRRFLSGDLDYNTYQGGLSKARAGATTPAVTYNPAPDPGVGIARQQADRAGAAANLHAQQMRDWKDGT